MVCWVDRYHRVKRELREGNHLSEELMRFLFMHVNIKRFACNNSFEGEFIRTSLSEALVEEIVEQTETEPEKIARSR